MIIVSKVSESWAVSSLICLSLQRSSLIPFSSVSVLYY
jgi:hypothetical protein